LYYATQIRPNGQPFVSLPGLLNYGDGRQGLPTILLWQPDIVTTGKSPNVADCHGNNLGGVLSGLVLRGVLSKTSSALGPDGSTDPNLQS